MKKVFALILTAILALSFAACTADAPKDETTQATTTETTTEAPAEPAAASALELLETVWASYADDEKFPAGGGDANAMVMDAPGAFGLEDAEVLDSMLALPADAVALVDDAASLMHMMNANTFTCGAFRTSDAAAVAAQLKDHIMQRQWMCGFPDKLVILTVGEYVVSAFGNNDLIDNFSARLQAAYEQAVLFCEEPLV